MDSCYRFEDVTKTTCAGSTTYRIEIAIMDMSTFAVDFSTPTSATFNPFCDLPEIMLESEPELGAFGANPATFKVKNYEFATGARFDTVLQGDSPYDRRWNIRVLVKNGVNYECRYWGVIDPNSIEYEVERRLLPDTWTMTFQAQDLIMLLDMIPASTFLTTNLGHGYEYCPDTVGGQVWATDNKPTGIISYRLTFVQHESLRADQSSNWVVYDETAFRFIKLLDILQCLSDSIAITASVWYYQSWDFIYEYGSADHNEVFQDLYLFRGFVVSPGVYAERGGLFDPAKTDPGSLYHSKTALDVLKRLLIPLGMNARISYDANNNPYMLIREAVHSQQTFNVTSVNNLLTGTRIRTADRVLGGIKVTVDSGNCERSWTEQGEGDDTIAISCIYQSAQSMWELPDALFGVTKQFDAMMNSLYVRPSSSNNIHSIYKINVKNYGQGSRVVTSNAYNEDNRKVVAMAAASYYFNPVLQSSDIVGVYRKFMRRIECTFNSLYTDYEPGDMLIWQMGTGAAITGYILSIAFDFTACKTKIIAETGDW